MIEAWYSLKSKILKLAAVYAGKIIEKRVLKSLLENKVLTESIDPSEGFICRQKKKTPNKQHG